MSNIDALENNPAFGVSAEEAAALRLDVIGKIKAGAARSYVTRVLRVEGAPAALAAVQNLLTAEGETADASVPKRERKAARAEAQERFRKGRL